MNIDHITLPPVTRKFYDRLVMAFPPINPLDINNSTNMIDIQRNAAQQEVIKYIEKYVVNSDADEEVTKTTLADKFKSVFNIGE